MDIYTKNAINNKLTKKQDTLVSGTNIKTINGNSLLGSGDLTISGSGAIYQHNLCIWIGDTVHYIYITIFNNSATALTVENIDQVFNAIKPNMTGTYCKDEDTRAYVYAFYVSGVVANTSFKINYESNINETITMDLVFDIVDSVSQIL